MEARVACVVPARLGSTRFPGKLLRPLLGKPLVVHALERAAGAGCFDSVTCFTDSPEIAAAVETHGFHAVLTGEAANGTERIARYLDALDALGADLIVNLQGDEPAFPEEGLRILCAGLRRNPEWVHTLVGADAPSDEDLKNPDRVKAVLDTDAFVTGFFRTGEAKTKAWPGSRSEVAEGERTSLAPTIADGIPYRLQLGAYAYSRKYLEKYAALPPSAAETELSHELLRAPSLAPLRAHFAPAGHAGASVDAPADMETARRALEAFTGLTATTGPLVRAPDSQPRLQGVPA